MNRTVTQHTASDPSDDAPGVISRFREAAHARRRRRADQRLLLVQLGEYRTTGERLELEAMLSRGSEREVEAIHHLLHAGRRAA